MFRLFYFAFLVLLIGQLVSPVSSFCKTLYVAADGSQEYKTLQSAVDAANEDGDIVEVADGIYRGPGNIDVEFRGFNIDLRSQNGPENCIIDCESKGRAFYLYRLEARYDTNTLQGSRIKGFTIKNAWSEHGGAIRCGEPRPRDPLSGEFVFDEYNHPGPTDNWASPTIEDCIIKYSYSKYVGGGIACNSSSPEIINCIITNNRAEWFGGGISARNSSYPLIRDSEISNNTAGNFGGGVFCYKLASNNPNITIENCVIKKNTATHDGGGISIWEAYPAISGCVIWGNSSYWGAGITTTNESIPTITNCVIAMNYAGGYGGAIHADTNSHPEISFCTISENYAFGGNNSNGFPFGYPSGGLYSRKGSSLVVTDTILWDNSKIEAGAYEMQNPYTNLAVIDDSGIMENPNNIFTFADPDNDTNSYIEPGFEGDGSYELPPDSVYRDNAGNVITGASDAVIGIADSENITPRPAAEEDEEFYECFITSAFE